MSEPSHRKVIIVGSGPAGYTAAIYTARANLSPLIITGNEPGGQLMTTTDVENYPGYPKGVSGPDMMDELREQAERFGTELVYDMVVEADLSQRPFRLLTDGGERYTADAIIISTGATAKYLGLPSERRLANKGVTACATCDGHFYAGMEVAVVGGGDTAMEEAQYLTRMCTKVHLIHRRDSFRASRIMQQRTLENPKIVVHWNREVVEVLARDDERLGEKVGGVRLRDTATGATEDIAVEGFFLAIGHVPNSQVFQGQLDMDETGYLAVEPGTTRTKIPGVFAAGDVADKVYRQAVTAAGTGCMAAIDAERWLAEHG
ncbi:thioredoxin-disulfide reductase [Nannocystaceae bacterium ST9]